MFGFAALDKQTIKENGVAHLLIWWRMRGLTFLFPTWQTNDGFPSRSNTYEPLPQMSLNE